LVKRPYEIINFTLRKRLEKELESREEKETKKRFKICIICKTRKSIFNFSVDRRSSDGRAGACKICKSKQSLKYYYEHKEEISIRVKEYRRTHELNRSVYFENYRKDNKEHLKKIASKWYKKNRKRIKKRALVYFEKNREYCLIVRGLWRKNHKEELKKYNRQYQKLRK